MKICWDNLEKIKYSKRTGKWYSLDGFLTYEYKDSCDFCKEPFLSVKYSNKPNRFCSISCGKKGNNNPNKRPEVVEKSNETKKKNKIKGDRIWNWKGGYRKRNLATYDSYIDRLSYVEICRRHPEDKNLLQVKCAYCGKWYTPSLSSIRHRINILEGIETRGEARLYCSTQCKQECPIFYQKLWPKGFKPATSREVQPELRQMCFERDNFTCQKCRLHQNKLKIGLHCHHIEGIRWEPLESADLNKVITLCKTCHIDIHKQPDCGYNDMKCK